MFIQLLVRLAVSRSRIAQYSVYGARCLIFVIRRLEVRVEDSLLRINKKLWLTKAKIQPSLMEIKLKVNIGKISKRFDN